MSEEKNWVERNPFTFGLIICALSAMLSIGSGIATGVIVNRIQYQDQHQRDLLQDSSLRRLSDSLEIVRKHLDDSVRIVRKRYLPSNP